MFCTYFERRPLGPLIWKLTYDNVFSSQYTEYNYAATFANDTIFILAGENFNDLQNKLNSTLNTYLTFLENLKIKINLRETDAGKMLLVAKRSSPF